MVHSWQTIDVAAVRPGGRLPEYLYVCMVIMQQGEGRKGARGGHLKFEVATKVFIFM